MTSTLRRRTSKLVLWIAVTLGLSVGMPVGLGMSAYAQDGMVGARSLAQTIDPSAKLSARLALLAQPSVRSQDATTQAHTLSLPVSGGGSLRKSPQGGVLVNIRLTDLAETNLRALTAAGARIVHVARDYRTVTASIRPDHLNAVAALDAVENVKEELHPFVNSVGAGDGPRAMFSRPAQIECPTATTSEGDSQLKADQARTAFAGSGIDGTGVNVGVLSDSYNEDSTAPTNADQDIATGDLPGTNNPCNRTTPVNVVADLSATDANPTDEGRAMLQIVHDLAPGANLSFATAFDGFFQFADNIQQLRTAANAFIIIDDASYANEPFFQDGPISVAVNNVVAQGARYFSAAGNANVVDSAGHSIGSYEAPAYRPTTCPKLPFPKTPIDCHNFNPKSGTPDNMLALTMGPGGLILLDLQWAEPWYGVQTDLDVYLVNSQGIIVGGSNDTNTGTNGTQMPFEFFGYPNISGSSRTLQVVIARSKGTNKPRFKYLFTQSQRLLASEYTAANDSVDTFGPTIFGHNGAASATSLAAVPYNNSNIVESYSSHGPVEIYYGPVINTTPAAALPSVQILNKPDVAATDDNQTTFFAVPSGGVYRFPGTSAAAPHAGAVAALMVQRATQRGIPFAQGLTQSLLRGTAAPIAGGSTQASGSGLVNALAALYAVEAYEPPPPYYLPLIRRQ